MRTISKYILFLFVLMPIFTIYAQDTNSWNAELDGIIYDLDVSSNGSLLLMGTRNDLAVAYSPAAGASSEGAATAGSSGVSSCTCIGRGPYLVAFHGAVQG